MNFQCDYKTILEILKSYNRMKILGYYLADEKLKQLIFTELIAGASRLSL